MRFIESSEQAVSLIFEHESMIQNDRAGKPWCRFACRA